MRSSASPSSATTRCGITSSRRWPRTSSRCRGRRCCSPGRPCCCCSSSATSFTRPSYCPRASPRPSPCVRLVFVAPSAETWLNLINSEFYFGDRRRRHPLFGRRAPAPAARADARARRRQRPAHHADRAVVFPARGAAQGAGGNPPGRHRLRRRAAAGRRRAHHQHRQSQGAPGAAHAGPGPVQQAGRPAFLRPRDRQGQLPLPGTDLHYTTSTLLACVGDGARGLRRHRVAAAPPPLGLLLLGTGLLVRAAGSRACAERRPATRGPGAGERYAFTPNFLIELAL